MLVVRIQHTLLHSPALVIQNIFCLYMNHSYSPSTNYDMNILLYEYDMILADVEARLI